MKHSLRGVLLAALVAASGTAFAGYFEATCTDAGVFNASGQEIQPPASHFPQNGVVGGQSMSSSFSAGMNYLTTPIVSGVTPPGMSYGFSGPISFNVKWIHNNPNEPALDPAPPKVFVRGTVSISFRNDIATNITGNLTDGVSPTTVWSNSPVAAFGQTDQVGPKTYSSANGELSFTLSVAPVMNITLNWVEGEYTSVYFEALYSVTLSWMAEEEAVGQVIVGQPYSAVV